MSFTSLVHQVENAIKVGSENYEIVEACIKAIEPGSKLRSYLEGKADLAFPILHKILRSHFGNPVLLNFIDNLPLLYKNLVKIHNNFSFESWIYGKRSFLHCRKVNQK